MDVFPFCFESAAEQSASYICINQNHIYALIVLNDAQPEMYGADKLYGWMAGWQDGWLAGGEKMVQI